MIKEAKNVDFYTTGRQPSAQDFARISQWIERDKKSKRPANRSQQLVLNRLAARVRAVLYPVILVN